MKATSTCSGPTFIKEGDKVSMLGDRQEVKDRLASKADCRLDSKKSEIASEWDNSRRKLVRPVEWTILTFERSCSMEAGRPDEHFEEVWRVIHAEVSKIPADVNLSIVVNDSDGKGKAYVPRGYVQGAYEVCTLGKFRKASPEVEALLTQTQTQEII